MLEDYFPLLFKSPVFSLCVTVAIAVLVGWILYKLGVHVLRGWFKSYPYAQIFLRNSAIPLCLLLILLVLQVLSAPLLDGFPFLAMVHQAMLLLFIAAMTWLLINGLKSAGQMVMQSYDDHAEDNLVARRIRTKMTVLVRVLTAVFIVLGFATALLIFPKVRQIGASLLASAGIAGLVIGFAAKSVLGNLIAGLYIAIAQPLRIDDVVVVEGEWGKIEEIAGAYIVVKVWDERRLIVPLQWFIDKPFQNWTRNSASITGTVFLWVDYRLSVDLLRKELELICRAAPEWDGRVSILQVTDVSAQAMQIRALVSSKNSGQNWDLRCRVREGLIAFLQREAPQALPHLRAEITQVS